MSEEKKRKAIREEDPSEPPTKKQKTGKHIYPTRRRKKKRKLTKKLKKKKKPGGPDSNEPVKFGYAESDVRLQQMGYKEGLKGLRALNNFVKSCLIEKYVYPKYDVLDLACGKGGDLGKFAHQKIRSWTGVDLVHNSLKDAMRRYNSRFHWNFEARFVACDVGEKNVFDYLPTSSESTERSHTFPIIRKFDVVSCQFAGHYLFESIKTFSSFMKNVTTGLKKGRYFICTVTDGLKYQELFQKNDGAHRITNGMYTIEFPTEPNWDEKFGNRVKFTLPGAIWDSWEYVVNPKHFKELSEQFFQLQCIEDLNFLDFVKKYRNQYRNLEKAFLKCKITEQEMETSGLYRVFVFRKMGQKETSSESSKFELGHRGCKEDEILNIL